MQAALLFYRKQGKILHENPCKYPHSLSDWHPLFAIDPDPFHAAAGRIAFKDKTTEILFFQIFHPLPSPLDHAISVVLPASGGDEPRGVRVSNQAKGFPRDRETAFHLWTYGNKFHKLSQGMSEEAIQFMTAVILHFFPQQTRATAFCFFGLMFTSQTV